MLLFILIFIMCIFCLVFISKIKALKFSGYIIIFGILGLIVSMFMAQFNPLYKGDVEYAIGRISFVLDDEVGYEFKIKDEVIQSSLKNPSTSFETEEPIIVRYLKDNYEVNAINTNDFIFGKEISIMVLSFFALAVGLGLSIVDLFFEKNRQKVYDEIINVDFNFFSITIVNFIHFLIAVLGFISLISGIVILFIDLKEVVFSIFCILVGMLFIGNYIYILKKNKR